MFRRESGQVLATLIRVLGDFDLAEDALQEAMLAALERWPRRRPARPTRRVAVDRRPGARRSTGSAGEASGTTSSGASAALQVTGRRRPRGGDEAT